MWYLKEFKNTEEYNSKKGDLVFPYLATCTEDSKNFVDNGTNGHKYVDLDLPSGTVWSPVSIGATYEYQYGQWFPWGHINQLTNCTWPNYRWYGGADGTKDNLKKYNTKDKIPVLEDVDDAAHVKMGGKWLLPMNTQIAELINNCVMSSENINGVNCLVMTSKNNGARIVFPRQGRRENNSSKYVGNYCIYQGKEVNMGDQKYAYSLKSADGGGFYCGTNSRRFGYPARGVINNIGGQTFVITKEKAKK